MNDEKQDVSGIYALVVMFVIGVLSIIFGNVWFKLIGWITIALVGLTSFHISRRYKSVEKEE